MIDFKIDDFKDIKDIWVTWGKLVKRDKCNKCDEDGLVKDNNNYYVCNCRKDKYFYYPVKVYLTEIDIEDLNLNNLKLVYTYLYYDISDSWGRELDTIIYSIDGIDFNSIEDDYSVGFINEEECKKYCRYITKERNNLSDEEMEKYY